jgi:hypothetical protein
MLVQVDHELEQCVEVVEEEQCVVHQRASQV